MKKLFSIAVAILFVASMVTAQGPNGKPAAQSTSTTPAVKKECSSGHSCCNKGEKSCCDKKSQASAKPKPASTNAPASSTTTTTATQSPK